MKVILDRNLSKEPSKLLVDLTGIEDWIHGPFTKIVLGVNSKEELLAVYEKAKAASLLCALIVDSGKTEFNGVPTETCVAIGPNLREDIDPITGELKPL